MNAGKIDLGKKSRDLPSVTDDRKRTEAGWTEDRQRAEGQTLIKICVDASKTLK